MKLILSGFVLITAILQIIYIPMIMLHVPFNVVYYTTIATIIIFISAFIVFLIKKKKIRKISKRKISKKEKAITIILLITIIIQAIVSAALFNENADDAFYVSLIEQCKDSNSIYTTEPSLGSGNTASLSRYMVSGYELSLAVLSKITTISPTTLTHSIIPFFMIVLSYMAYYVFARKFFNPEKSKIFILLISILFLFSGFTTMFRGVMLLSRMWQGKGIFLNLILTLIISNLISLNKYNQKRKLIGLTALNFSAVFFTNTAIFLVPFTYFAFGVIELFKRNWKLLLKLFLTGIPIVIYGALYLIFAKDIKGAQIVEINVVEVMKNYFGTGYYHILYVLSLFVIMAKGSKRAKKYFLLVPLINSLVLYNPLFTNILTKYFTRAEVFWRLFWLLPVEFSIAYALTIILNLKNTKLYKITVGIIEIMLLVLMGKFIYTKDNGFEIAENTQKIPQSIINNVQYILENTGGNNTPTLIAPPEPLHSATIRQITSKINLLWSRDIYMNELLSGEELAEKNLLYGIEKSVIPEINSEDYDKLREKYEVNWIIIDSKNNSAVEYLDETSHKNKVEIDGYLLYQY